MVSIVVLNRLGLEQLASECYRTIRRRTFSTAQSAIAAKRHERRGLISIYRRGPWRSFEAVEFATLEWVDWFNNRRLLEPIGNIPPAEAEERYYAILEKPAMAA